MVGWLCNLNVLVMLLVVGLVDDGVDVGVVGGMLCCVVLGLFVWLIGGLCVMKCYGLYVCLLYFVEGV